jgi:ribosome biogenesis GTPase
VQLAEVEDGLEDVFEDITELAGQCRFADCRHESEPGCAVLNAVAGDTLDEVRLGRYFKLQAEEALNTQTVAQRRSHNKTFGKLIKDVKKEKKKRQR